MKEYLFLSCIMTVGIMFLDDVLKTKLRQRKKFWIFHAVIVVVTTMVDSYSSGRPFVFFNDQFVYDWRIFSVPLENYVFGFNLLTLNLIFFEYFANKHV